MNFFKKKMTIETTVGKRILKGIANGVLNTLALWIMYYSLFSDEHTIENLITLYSADWGIKFLLIGISLIYLMLFGIIIALAEYLEYKYKNKKQKN